MSIRIVTDSTAYLPKDLLDKYSIEVLALSVSFDDEVYKETEITNEFFFNKLDNFQGFPKSSQPSLDDTMTLFKKILDEGHDLIGVFLSSEMSGTYQSAVMLSNELKADYPNQKIKMIDSRSNCMQLGLAVLKGAEKQSETYEVVVETIEHVISHSRFVFMPDTLEYLRRGGRIGTAKALLSSVLQIKPILTVEEGKTHALNKVRTRKKAMNALIEIFKQDLEHNTLLGAYVHHIHCEEEAKQLVTKLGGNFGIVPIGPVIGTHVGPGAIGIAYCWE